MFIYELIIIDHDFFNLLKQKLKMLKLVFFFF